MASYLLLWHTYNPEWGSDSCGGAPPYTTEPVAIVQNHVAPKKHAQKYKYLNGQFRGLVHLRMTRGFGSDVSWHNVSRSNSRTSIVTGKKIMYHATEKWLLSVWSGIELHLTVGLYDLGKKNIHTRTGDERAPRGPAKVDFYFRYSLVYGSLETKGLQSDLCFFLALMLLCTVQRNWAINYHLSCRGRTRRACQRWKQQLMLYL